MLTLYIQKEVEKLLVDKDLNIDDYILLSKKDFERLQFNFVKTTYKMTAVISFKHDDCKQVIIEKNGKWKPMAYINYISTLKVISDEIIGNKQTLIDSFLKQINTHKIVYFNNVKLLSNNIERSQEFYAFNNDIISNITFSFEEITANPLTIPKLNNEDIYCYILPKNKQ